MNIKRGYYYIYYTLYGFVKFFPKPIMGINFTICLFMISLQLFVVFSILFYFDHLCNVDILLYNNLYVKLIIFGPILLINFNALSSEDKWERYFIEFDDLPKKKKIIYNALSWIIILFILFNLFFSCYLLYH